ncbi:MAG TPA: PD-(D/E)XK nuclease family protein [Acidothermaceae bacterium]|nr:PD-(D/E)XK nuclease family protein [Acidothermaceae bacterium]
MDAQPVLPVRPAEQLGLVGMASIPGRLFACTPSRLTSWVDCPRRYRLTYLDRPRPPAGPPWAHNSFGAGIHNALAGWWRLPRGQRSVGAAGQLLDAGWSAEGFRDPAQSSAWLVRGRALVQRYVAALDPGREPLGVERTIAARTNRLALSGRVDRLDDRDGELVVVDYKTGRRPLTVDDTRGSMALALYAVAAAATLRRRCVRVELHHLPTGEVHAYEHTDESLQRQVRRAEQIADEAEAATAELKAQTAAAPVGAPAPASAAEMFAPRPGSQCGWCDMRAHCPEGAAAAPAQLPWAGLGEDKAGEADAGQTGPSVPDPSSVVI